MLNRYYQSELGRLRQLADEFSHANPALAPLLGADAASDPDVERLLEGVAFLTGMVHQRLDDDFSEFVQPLAQLLYPHYLQPLPCMTLVQLQPRMPLEEPMQVAAGCEVTSVPVDGQRLRFRSTLAVDLQPVQLVSTRWDGSSGEARSLVLDFRFTTANPSLWAADSLMLYLGDGLAEAAKLLRLLQLHLRNVSIFAAGQPLTQLTPDHLRAVGFDDDKGLLPFPDNAHPAYRYLQEYFALPEKFLFMELSGFTQWRARGDDGTFSVRLTFDSVPEWAPGVSANSFMLGVTPAVNLFEHEAHPIKVDHRYPEYRVQPIDHGQRVSVRIHSVTKVDCYTASGIEKRLKPFDAFAARDVYHLTIRASSVDVHGYDHYLSLPYSVDADLSEVTLSAGLLCTNGKLAENLRLGDLSQPGDNAPPRLEFKNIRGITPFQPPRFDSRLLWRVLSQLNTNHFRLADCGYLKALLSLYLPTLGEHVQDGNQRLIDSIENVSVSTERRFIRGLPVDGSVVRVDCRGIISATTAAFICLVACSMSSSLAALQ
ncbi:type VI secretion system baseplate subunit TssF [Pseudomonas plecoglossicida]|uniref:type VI secretion system baseplate subunit TssF n=1 Tax=Pseudomonas plecoglossicida TaxID=70775 RepID=UPI003CEF3621